MRRPARPGPGLLLLALAATAVLAVRAGGVELPLVLRAATPHATLLGWTLLRPPRRPVPTSLARAVVVVVVVGALLLR